MDFNKYFKRTSVRAFLNKAVEPEKIKTLIDVINSAPTSNNGHTYSAILLDKCEVRTMVGEKFAMQRHVADAPLFFVFCIDLNRIEHAGAKQQVEIREEDLERLVVPTGDAYIAASFLVNAALDMGLGTCYVGFVRRYIPEFTKALNLTGRIVPILGISLGYPDKINEVKPKINHVYHNTYDLAKVQKEVDEYDEIMLKYYDSRSGNQKPYHTWSSGIVSVYQPNSTEINEPLLKVWKTKIGR